MDREINHIYKPLYLYKFLCICYISGDGENSVVVRWKMQVAEVTGEVASEVTMKVTSKVTTSEVPQEQPLASPVVAVAPAQPAQIDHLFVFVC